MSERIILTSQETPTVDDNQRRTGKEVKKFLHLAII